MDCLVGSANGMLKSEFLSRKMENRHLKYHFSGINLTENTFSNLSVVSSLVPKRDEITSLCWSDEEQTELLSSQLDRQLKLFDTVTGNYSSLFNVHGGDGPIKGVQVVEKCVKFFVKFMNERFYLFYYSDRNRCVLVNWSICPITNFDLIGHGGLFLSNLTFNGELPSRCSV